MCFSAKGKNKKNFGKPSFKNRECLNISDPWSGSQTGLFILSTAKERTLGSTLGLSEPVASK